MESEYIDRTTIGTTKSMRCLAGYNDNYINKPIDALISPPLRPPPFYSDLSVYRYLTSYRIYSKKIDRITLAVKNRHNFGT